MSCPDRMAMLFPSPHAGVISFKPTPEQPELPVFSISPHCSNARGSSEILSISVSTAPAVTSEIISAQQGAWHLPPSSIYSESQADFLLQSANAGAVTLQDVHVFFFCTPPAVQGGRSSNLILRGPNVEMIIGVTSGLIVEVTSKLVVNIDLPVSNRGGWQKIATLSFGHKDFFCSQM